MINIICHSSGSTGNLYLIKNENTNILLECGQKKETIIKFLRDNGLLMPMLNGCLISHYHTDHSLSVKYVSDYVDTYGTEQLKEICPRTHIIAPRTPFKVGSIKVLPIPINHGETLNNAFVLRDSDSIVFFGTDFMLMTQNVSNFKFDKVYIELNYEEEPIDEILEQETEERKEKYIRQVSTHMSKKSCIEHLKHMDLSNCKEIVLLHRSKFLTNRPRIKEELEGIFNIPIRFVE